MSDDQPEIFIATEGANFYIGTEEFHTVPGVTTVRKGHPMLAAHPDLFKPFSPTYDWTPAAASVRADQRGARSRLPVSEQPSIVHVPTADGTFIGIINTTIDIGRLRQSLAAMTAAEKQETAARYISSRYGLPWITDPVRGVNTC